jgi:hypothetical protein
MFSELSPHGILISASKVTKLKLFVKNSSGEIGVVGDIPTVHKLPIYIIKVQKTDLKEQIYISKNI